ncbi:MAG: tRNA (adenosine(37)-N6)-threonylcarbamoyltransferase complex ATPase subunit type 1 TsaE [Parachlamydiaceae bacterium]|nr:tRNA (adenosine(37)-N6)-threonylcarbamoyltransferase complex ATPase subunit type 1 TsaE [Parachlamydiaceae bacterium]
MEQFVTHSAAETMEWGRQLGLKLPLHSIVCLFGDLAAGKTTLIKGLVAGAANIDPSEVQSPTFTYLHIYNGDKKVFHFDLYRLRDVDEFLGMGFDEYFESGGICCIEWSERIASHLPANSIHITLSHEGLDKRKITVRDSNETIF